MAKLIDEAEIHLDYWAVSIKHDNYNAYRLLQSRQRYWRVPRFVDLQLDDGSHKKSILKIQVCLSDRHLSGCVIALVRC